MKYYLSCVLTLLLISCDNSKHIQDFGVVLEWNSGGATSSYPSIEVYANTSKGKLESPIIFGGIEDATLSYKDMDDDGITDIVFGNKKLKQILAYKPEKEAFVILRDDMKGRLF